MADKLRSFFTTARPIPDDPPVTMYARPACILVICVSLLDVGMNCIGICKLEVVIWNKGKQPFEFNCGEDHQSFLFSCQFNHGSRVNVLVRRQEPQQWMWCDSKNDLGMESRDMLVDFIDMILK